MKHRTATLEGTNLDYAVAMALGNVVSFGVNRVTKEPIALMEVDGGIVGLNDVWFRPSTKWSQGGPIIEREHITIVSPAPWRGTEVEWSAAFHVSTDDAGNDDYEHEEIGPTALIAAMRCFVASKLGEEVDIP